MYVGYSYYIVIPISDFTNNTNFLKVNFFSINQNFRDALWSHRNPTKAALNWDWNKDLKFADEAVYEFWENSSLLLINQLNGYTN